MLAIRFRRHGFLATAAVAVVSTCLSARALADDTKPSTATPAVLRTAKITRGDAIDMIEATGTIEPEMIVDVGAQVAGRIVSLGADPHNAGKPIDFNSQVEDGTVLAQIEKAPYIAQVERARASQTRYAAELALSKSKLELAGAQWRHAQEALKSKAISEAELDVAKFTLAAAKPVVALAEANLAASEAELKQAELNLDWTRITSPVKGTVIDRRVNVGQSVAASLDSPSLFLIATDLKKLVIWVSVNEADIGPVRKGQPVDFTVDAFPDKIFHGSVDQIRLNATMTQNVVTYTVTVPFDNSAGKLFPYLTANVKIEVGRRNQVLFVPSAALRWRPRPEWVVPAARQKLSAGSHNSEGQDVPPGAATPRRKQPDRVWIPDGKFVRPIEVEIGLRNGTQTEIRGRDLKDGLEVIVGGGLDLTGTDRKILPGGEAIARQDFNLLMVHPGKDFGGGIANLPPAHWLTPQDAEAIARQCPSISAAAPVVRARAWVTYAEHKWVPAYIYGTTPDFLATRNWEELAAGEPFTDRDVRNANKVCLIGETINQQLFHGNSPIDKELRIHDVAFRVVGVLGRKGPNLLGLDQDDIVLAPWTAIRNSVVNGAPAAQQSGESHQADSATGEIGRIAAAIRSPDSPSAGNATVDEILAKPVALEQIPDAIDEITQAIRARHHIRPGGDDDFQIRDFSEMLKVLERAGK